VVIQEIDLDPLLSLLFQEFGNFLSGIIILENIKLDADYMSGR
jgi:hypothetical protein